MTIFESSLGWNNNRPRTLVVACSDGRLQVNVDEFLEGCLEVTRYDRLYMPGGPGALATSGVEYVRSDRNRQEMSFLLLAHKIELVVLLFHGPAPGGPDEAACADYQRILGGVSGEVLSKTQVSDFKEVRDFIQFKKPGTEVRGFRCEVTAERTIRFVELLSL
ncbi:MAG: hypothetical protein JSS66_12870 [Armatimonadetes bacterium]|nr:hypothetical protein [Armatimonadota bacterium]